MNMNMTLHIDLVLIYNKKNYLLFLLQLEQELLGVYNIHNDNHNDNLEYEYQYVEYEYDTF